MDDSQRRVSDALDALTAAVEDETLPAGVAWSLGYLRAWMEDGMVSGRTTGATDAQIEAAARRMIAEWWVGQRWDSDAENIAGDQARSWARFLVPPDERIVKASEVPTPEQRAAVGRLVEVYAARMAYARNSSPADEMPLWEAVRDAQDAIQDGDIAAARAVAEGGHGE